MILRRRRFSRPGLFLSASENDHLKSCIARDLCHGVPPFAVGSMRMRVCRAPAASRSSGSRLYRCCDGGCAPPPLGFSAGGGICGKRVKPPVPATRCDAACADGAPFAKPVRYFVAVFQSGSLSAAAKEQYVTVQAVSKAIADLERELKNELFVRESRGVHPTLFGKAFYVKAEPVLRSFDELEAFAHRRRSAESPLLRLGLCASPLYGYEQACASIASFVYKNSGIETSIRLEAGLRGFGALQAGHLDALIVVGACRHPDMDCLNLGKVMLGVIMSYRHPLAQHQTVSLDDIKPYPVSISEDFDRFNDSVAEFYRERGIDILVSATTAAQFERYLTRENGLALTVGVPALGQFNPLTELKPMAAKDSVSVPICLVSLKGRKAPAYAGFERWMTNELAVKGGDPVRRFVSTTASTPACSEAGTGC